MTDQLSAARSRANRVRAFRTRIRRTQDMELLASALANRHPFIASWRVDDALATARGMGSTKTRTVCDLIGISPGDRIGELAEEPLGELVLFVQRLADGWAPIESVRFVERIEAL